ncbi:MAG: ribosome assembly cofactor RimP [Flavobacteriales bacterium]|jgi:ribosome maturation factor RimP|nr:ribosome assembly cofactor RimP [Flavobacteriales bacterium]MBT5090519.1 ribosome assembly cofactor RimP [Flavobacteriales bacterium]
MISKEEIKRVAEPKIKEQGGFFVDVKVNTANVITIFFDRMEGVQVGHCLLISKYIEEHFDREVEDYELTVCSAGLENPFMVDEQYQKYIGKEVGVLLTNGKRKTGVILSYDKSLLLEVVKKKKGSRKNYILEEVSIPKKEIKETKLKINFK